MRNFSAVLIAWNLAFIIVFLRFSPQEEWHTIYLAVFLLLMLIPFPLSFLINRMVDQLELGRFFIKLGLYISVCSFVWIFFDPYFIFFYEGIVVVISFAILYEWLGRLPQKLLHNLVKGGLLVSFLLAFILYVM